MSSAAVVEAHRAAGRFFEAGGVKSFVREEGSGPAVVCVHGVPASCFLYRKVLPELASRGLRGVAFDLPGLGLADRPKDYDYTWSGLGRFAAAAVDALELERFHLVVHDIGGPVGFELAAARKDRVASLTVLNTMIEVERFTKPWTMRPFGTFLGGLWLATTVKPVFRKLMHVQGIADRASVSKDELDAWHDLLLGDDGGEAFLKIMRGFETTAEKQALYTSVVKDVPYSVQVVWGELDPALTLKHHGAIAQRLTGVETIHRVPGKHFLQEDNAPAIAERVAALALA